MPKPKLNKPLITKLIKELNKNPLLYLQEAYITKININTGCEYDEDEDPSKQEIEDIADQLTSGENHIELAKRLLEIEPASTFCKTACCLAGTVAVMEAGENNVIGGYCVEIKGDTLEIHDFAQGKLGLSVDAANTLFAGDPECDWPEPWAERWTKALRNYGGYDIKELKKLRKAQVKIACDLLETLKAKGEKILLDVDHDRHADYSSL